MKRLLRFSVIFFSLLYYYCNVVKYHVMRANDRFVVQKIARRLDILEYAIDRVSCRVVSCRVGAHPYGGRGRKTWRRYAYRALLFAEEKLGKGRARPLKRTGSSQSSAVALRLLFLTTAPHIS